MISRRSRVERRVPAGYDTPERATRHLDESRRSAVPPVPPFVPPLSGLLGGLAIASDYHRIGGSRARRGTLRHSRGVRRAVPKRLLITGSQVRSLQGAPTPPYT